MQEMEDIPNYPACAMCWTDYDLCYSNTDNSLSCMNGESQSLDDQDFSWQLCQKVDSERDKCPNTWPYMCASKYGASGQDYPCAVYNECFVLNGEGLRVCQDGTNPNLETSDCPEKTTMLEASDSIDLTNLYDHPGLYFLNDGGRFTTIVPPKGLYLKTLDNKWNINIRVDAELKRLRVATIYLEDLETLGSYCETWNCLFHETQKYITFGNVLGGRIYEHELGIEVVESSYGHQEVTSTRTSSIMLDAMEPNYIEFHYKLQTEGVAVTRNTWRFTLSYCVGILGGIMAFGLTFARLV
eukprot:UN22744